MINPDGRVRPFLAVGNHHVLPIRFTDPIVFRAHLFFQRAPHPHLLITVSNPPTIAVLIVNGLWIDVDKLISVTLPIIARETFPRIHSRNNSRYFI